MRLNQCFQEKDWIQLRISIEELDLRANGNIRIEPNLGKTNQIETCCSLFLWLCHNLRVYLGSDFLSFLGENTIMVLCLPHTISFLSCKRVQRILRLSRGRIESNASIQKCRLWLNILYSQLPFFCNSFDSGFSFSVGLSFLDRTHDLQVVLEFWEAHIFRSFKLSL